MHSGGGRACPSLLADMLAFPSLPSLPPFLRQTTTTTIGTVQVPVVQQTTVAAAATSGADVSVARPGEAAVCGQASVHNNRMVVGCRARGGGGKS